MGWSLRRTQGKVKLMSINDSELEFLGNLTSKELDPLVDALLDSDHKGRLMSELNGTPSFKKYYPDHAKYVGEMVHELQKFGGNTIANIFRGGEGVAYREILCDVCDHMKVNYNDRQSTQMIEDALLSKVLAQVWEEMTPEQREAVLKDTGYNAHAAGGVTSAMMIALFRSGGFASYRLTLIVINAVWRIIFGKGLTLAANKTVCQFLAILSGPVGWVLTGPWTAADLASPAMRVTIPAVIYIAGMRKMKKQEADLAELKGVAGEDPKGDEPKEDEPKGERPSESAGDNPGEGK